MLRRKLLSISVPVKPISVAFGSAFDMRAPSGPYCERWASSTMTIMFSHGLSTSSSLSGTLKASANFWMVVITVRPAADLRTVCRSRGPCFRGSLRARRSGGSGRERSIRSGAGKLQRSKVPLI